MPNLSLESALKELFSAEDFLEFFDIEYDSHVVQVNRLHILQRFHDYLEQAGELPEDEMICRAMYTRLLSQAYEDFVHSNALTEKVFPVFHQQQLPAIVAAVPISTIIKRKSNETLF
jgi:nitrogenase-stabilizing/protective protein